MNILSLPPGSNENPHFVCGIFITFLSEKLRIWTSRFVIEHSRPRRRRNQRSNCFFDWDDARGEGV